MLLLTVHNLFDLTTGRDERITDNGRKVIMDIAAGVALHNDLVMRRHAYVNADMIGVLGMLMGRILLNEHPAASDMVARHLELGHLLLDHSLDLVFVLNVLHDEL